MSLNVSHADAYLKQLDPSTRSQNIAIYGGTDGIGAAIAVELAKLGFGKVYIIGRNETKGEGVIKRMSENAAAGTAINAKFIQSDLSTLKGMKGSVEQLQQAVGTEGLDVVMMLQNGMPSGKTILTEDGYEQGFAVQSLARFALTYHLIQTRTIKPDAKVLLIANSGNNLPTLSVDDLDLQKSAKAGRNGGGLFYDQSRRDSTVIDCMTLEYHRRFPQYKIYNLFPGAVQHGNFDFSLMPNLFFNIAMRAAYYLTGVPAEQYAKVPLYIAFCDSKERKTYMGDSLCWGPKLASIKVGKKASDPKFREQVFDKLAEMSGVSNTH